MIKSVLFDVDGVLLDSFEVNRSFYNKIFQEFGRKPISAKEYKNMFSLPLRSVIKKSFPLKSKQEIGRIIDYAESKVPEFYKLVKLNPDAREIVEKLSKGFMLGIVTSRAKSVKVLEIIKIRKYFKVLVGYYDVKSHKPHPEPIHLALRRLKVRPEEAVYVGDAASDLEAGKAAGVKVIIYRNPKVKGDYNIRDFREIPKIVEKLNGKN